MAWIKGMNGDFGSGWGMDSGLRRNDGWGGWNDGWGGWNDGWGGWNDGWGSRDGVEVGLGVVLMV